MDEIINKKKNVSFSQFSWYLKCPHHFFLDRVKNLKEFTDTINTCFGTAVHEAIQLYIKTLYTEGFEKADSLEVFKLFKEYFERELSDKKIKYTDEDYTGFIFDGEDIIKEFLNTSTRIENFPNNKYEFLGVETEIDMPIKNNVNFMAYIDLVLKDKKTGDIKIIDFKTSTNGWNKYTKDDYTKLSQLLLYKAFYSRKFNIPLNKIDVEFFILKRKLYENSNFPQSRIQTFIPLHNDKVIVATINTFIEFLDTCFTPDGQYIQDVSHYPKQPGERKKHCKYCPHKDKNCDAKETKI